MQVSKRLGCKCSVRVKFMEFTVKDWCKWQRLKCYHLQTNMGSDVGALTGDVLLGATLFQLLCRVLD